MEIAETSIFTKEITKLLTDDEYRELQNFLICNPKRGDVIKGSGGLRKLNGKQKVVVKEVVLEIFTIIMKRIV